MKQSQLFTKTLKSVSGDEAAVNARLLSRGGFVYKNSAGVYTYLPLGWRVIEKINRIIREEMNAIGGVELFMPALVDSKYMEPTKRWDIDVGFKAVSQADLDNLTPKTYNLKPNYVLGWTHEEVLTAIASHYVSSYRDLPFAAYQIQTKFRNEARAKSGLLRGREFLMKDLYSFHTSEEDLFEYYDRVKEAYLNVFKRCGLEALYTVAAGGDFTVSNTHEFQVLADVGEDTIYYCEKCRYAENSDISKLKKGVACPKCRGAVVSSTSIEVGNIFPLGTKYSEALNLKFKDEAGGENFVVMGSYGIGISRLMAAIIEVHHDEKGILWPESTAPFAVHLIVLQDAVRKKADELYQKLVDAGVEVLYDDRSDVSAGEKFADADLIGIPTRAVVSEKSLKEGGAEVKKRSSGDSRVFSFDELYKHLAGS